MSEQESERDAEAEDASKRTTIIRITSWEEFESEIKKFEDPSRKPWDEVWFRGQSDATWLLQTSLERRSDRTRAVADYLNLISEIQPAIETFIGSQFEIPCRLERERFCREYDLFDQNLRDLATYLAHLRHGLFPLRFWIGPRRPMLRRTSPSITRDMMEMLRFTHIENGRASSRCTAPPTHKSLASDRESKRISATSDSNRATPRASSSRMVNGSSAHTIPSSNRMIISSRTCCGR